MKKFVALSLALSAVPAYAQDKLETIVVTGTRSNHTEWDSPVATQTIVVDDEAIQHYNTVADILLQAPGLDLVDGVRGQSIRLDGFDPKYTLVLINGQRLTGKISDAYDLRSIELDGVQRIEIIRGAGSALYGSDAIAGVVNIITKPNVKHRVRLHADTNKQHDALLSTGLKGEDASVSLEVFRHENDAINAPGSEATRISEGKKTGAQIEPRYQTENWDLRSRLHASEEKLDATEVSAAGAILKRYNELDTNAISLEPTRYFADKSELRMSVKREQTKTDYKQAVRRTGMELAHQKTDEEVIETNISYLKPLESQTLNLGVQHINEQLESDRMNKAQVERGRAAVFVQDEIRVGSTGFSLIPAIRQDQDTQYGGHTSKKLGLRYDITANQAVLLSYGEGYRAPSFNELYMLFENNSVGYVVEGNDKLIPESSRSAHAQYNIRGEGWNASVSLFHNRIKDLIENLLVRQDENGVIHYTYVNISAAETMGSDISYSTEFNRYLSLNLGYGFLQARDLSRQTALAGRSKHSLSYQINFSYEQWTLSNQFKLQSSRLGDTDRLNSKNALLIGDVILSYRQNPSWLYSIAIENLGANSGDIYGYVAPRSLGASITWLPKI